MFVISSASLFFRFISTKYPLSSWPFVTVVTPTVNTKLLPSDIKLNYKVSLFSFSLTGETESQQTSKSVLSENLQRVLLVYWVQTGFNLVENSCSGGKTLPDRENEERKNFRML